jgi:hypothetical protein
MPPLPKPKPLGVTAHPGWLPPKLGGPGRKALHYMSWEERFVWRTRKFRSSDRKVVPDWFSVTRHQFELLSMLAEFSGPVSRDRLRSRLMVEDEKTGEVKRSWTDMYVTRQLGIADDYSRQILEGSPEVGYPCLVSLGLVEVLEYDIDGIKEVGYRITREGRAALKDGGRQAIEQFMRSSPP